MGETAHETMRALGDEYWEFQLETSPTYAFMLGYHRYGDRHEDYSRLNEDAQIAKLRDLVARAEALDPDDLDENDRVSREVLIFDAETTADLAEFREMEHFVNHTVGIPAMLPNVPPQLPVVEPEHATNLVAKYREMGRSFDQHTERLKQGLSRGRVPIASTVAKTIEQIDSFLETDPASSFFTQVRVPDAFDDAERARWLSELAEVVAHHVYPAMQRHRDLLHQEILPAGRSDEASGILHLEDGDEYYRTAIRRYTSLDMNADEIHRIGLDHIATLDDEYRELGAEVLGTTDLPEIYRRLREDPDLHFTSGPEIIAASEVAMAKARAAIPEWFGRLPKADCLVSETHSGPEAFYMPPAPDGSRPGTFFVNTKDPAGWGHYQIEAMAYHEGIPGHHMQLAIAQELEDQPTFRKHAGITAYAEGWGLYTERLADEMNLYSRPLDRIGMLTLDSMRASRLVVDTGLHALGWSRQQAIDFCAANSPMALTAIRNEVDRYIGLPGQALAYMLGRIEIMRIRTEAEKAMGSRFDIKGFHDTVLGHGMVPLGTLDRLVQTWAAA